MGEGIGGLVAQTTSRHAPTEHAEASRVTAHRSCYRPLSVAARFCAARAVRRTCMTMTAGLSLRPPSRPQAKPEPEG